MSSVHVYKHTMCGVCGAVTALCEWYALHAVDSDYELYCDDNEMRVGTKASMIEWLHDMWTEFA